MESPKFENQCDAERRKLRLSNLTQLNKEEEKNT